MAKKLNLTFKLMFWPLRQLENVFLVILRQRKKLIRPFSHPNLLKMQMRFLQYKPNTKFYYNISAGETRLLEVQCWREDSYAFKTIYPIFQNEYLDGYP